MKKYIFAACTTAIIALTSCGSLNMNTLYMVEPVYRCPAIFDNDSVRVTFDCANNDPYLFVIIENKSNSKAEVLWYNTYIDEYNMTELWNDKEKLYPKRKILKKIRIQKGANFYDLFRYDDIKKKGYAERFVSIPIQFEDKDVFCNVRLRIAKNKKSRLKDLQ